VHAAETRLNVPCPACGQNTLGSAPAAASPFGK
jgi:hypothetical protein